jgi:hypothetical protein
MGALLAPRRGTAYAFEHRDGAGRLLWASGVADHDLDEIRRLEERHGRTLDVRMALDDAKVWQPNALADEGERDMLETFWRANVTPTFYLALVNSTPTDTTTMATLSSEVSGTSYARIQLVRGTSDWGAAALVGGDYQTTSASKVFTAGGTWTSATNLCIVTSSSGTTGSFYAWAALGGTRTLLSADTLTVSAIVSLG